MIVLIAAAATLRGVDWGDELGPPGATNGDGATSVAGADRARRRLTEL